MLALLAALAAPTLAAPALSGLVVRAELAVADAPPVEIVRAVGPDAPPQVTVLHDPVGLRWEVILDADTYAGPAGDRAVAYVAIRVIDDRGRVVGRFQPMVMGGFDAPMTTVSVTDPDEPGLFFDLDVVVSRTDGDDPTLTRSLFSERGLQAYSFARLGEVGALTCEDPALVVANENGVSTFTLTGRFQPGDRFDTRCVDAAGERSLPISLAFL